MAKELIEKYEKLSLNEKRNELNQEMIKISEIFIQLSRSKNYPINDFSLINYNSASKKYINETEFLNMSYQNLMNIREIILNYITFNEQGR